MSGLAIRVVLGLGDRAGCGVICRAQQRSAAPCGVVPCPSFCDAVSCGAVRSFEHAAVTVCSSSSTRYDTGTRCMYVLCILTRGLLLSSVS